MTVGNMMDAVDDGERSTSGVEMSPSSSFGPADDGRIKPDIVANGHGLRSATNESNSSYGVATGTSMAAPGACGVGLLLHEHYHRTTGQFMRASTLKGLMIHTATDLFNVGPDYQSGWGLVNALEGTEQIKRHAANPGVGHIVEGLLADDVL